MALPCFLYYLAWQGTTRSDIRKKLETGKETKQEAILNRKETEIRIIPILERKAKRKGETFLPSFKLFQTIFGNVLKIAYTGARSLLLTLPENTFLLFITIFLHPSFSFLH